MAKSLFQLIGIMFLMVGCGSTMTPNQTRMNVQHADAIGEDEQFQEEYAFDDDNSAQVSTVEKQTSATQIEATPYSAVATSASASVIAASNGPVGFGEIGAIQGQSSSSSVDRAAPITQTSVQFDAEKLKISPVLLAQALAERERTKALTTNKRYFAVVDFSLPSTEKRFWLIDANSGKLVFRSYVSHGKGSGSRLYATKFSNAVGSNASSLGSYIATTPYKGDHGPALRMIGVSATNSNAFKRNIVIHGATYVPILDEVMIKIAGAGRSNGCFAFGFDKTAQVVSALKGGGFIYAGLSRQLKATAAPRVAAKPAKPKAKTKVAKR
jgi:hypothetical protein